MKPRIPLNHLNTFAAAADNLSFQVAATRLNVTPSAVSHQVRSLEGLLGYPLFDRVDKGVRLTARGQALFGDINRPLKQLHEAIDTALRPQNGNVLTVSVAPVFATRWLIPRVSLFRHEYPDIALSVIATADLLDFHADGIDCAIRLGSGRWTGTDAERLFRTRIAAVCAPSVVEANGGRFATQELAVQKRVHNLGMPDLWKRWFESAGVQYPKQEPTLQVQSAAQVLEALQADDCIGLFDLNLVEEELEAGRIRLACDFVLEDDEGYYLVMPYDRAGSTPIRDFSAWLQSQIEADVD